LNYVESVAMIQQGWVFAFHQIIYVLEVV